MQRHTSPKQIPCSRCGKLTYIQTCQDCKKIIKKEERQLKLTKKKFLQIMKRRIKQLSQTNPKTKRTPKLTKYNYIKLTSLSQDERELFSCMFRNGQIPEHRLVLAKFLKRPLLKNEIVHHINGNKKDNRIENLLLCRDSTEHLFIHLNKGELVQKLLSRISYLESLLQENNIEIAAFNPNL